MPTVDELVERVVGAPPRLGRVRLVCVDGPAGSGKSTLADRLAAPLAAAVLHLDDLYEGWSGLEGVAERLEDQVLTPLSQGRPARYQRYDWTAGAFAEWHEFPVPPVLVVEGCGSARRAVADRASCVLFVEAPADVRLARGLARDGEALREHWLRWMGLESAHFAVEGTRQRADVVLDGTASLT